MITQKLVRSIFDYRDGELYWRVKSAYNIKIGSKAGSLNNNTGYYTIGINRKLYKTHRLIFLYINGYLPKYLDHIDQDKQNNHIENLREITKSQNGMNRKPNKNCSSIYKGVTWDKNKNKWKAQIKIDKRRKNLGSFESETSAAIAYNNAATKYYGEYANLNKI